MTLAELMNLAVERAEVDGMRLTLVVDPIQPAAPQPIERNNKPWTLDQWSGFVNERFEVIESRLAALESDNQCMVRIPTSNVRLSVVDFEKAAKGKHGFTKHKDSAPAQTRRYPVVEWAQKADRQLACINGIQVGEVWDDGSWRLGIEYPFSENGNVESAKAALESKFRRWWDELHNLNSTTQTT